MKPALAHACSIGATLLSQACVPSVPHFVTGAEARGGHPSEHAGYTAADEVLEPGLPPPPPVATSGTRVATPSYWHWNGLEYELVPGTLEETQAPYLWRWRDDPPLRAQR